MDLHHPTRRQFLHGTLAGAAGLALAGCIHRWPAWQEFQTRNPDEQPERWALLADAHIAADATRNYRFVNMADNLRRAVTDVLATGSIAGAILAGDCAHLQGKVEDYQTFKSILIEPLTGAGMPLHIVPGNHDEREHLQSILPQAPTVLPGRFASVIPSRHANWFLLDSLAKTGQLGGQLGPEQLRWLDGKLAGSAEKPAIIVLHHPPDMRALIPAASPNLRDGDRLRGVLLRHPHVKACIFGHTHACGLEQQDGIHLINLPATAYVFTPGHPHAWVEAALWRDGIELTLRPVTGNSEALPMRASLKWSERALPHLPA